MGFVVLSLVLLAAMRGMGLSIRTQGDVEQRQVALWSADNALVQLRAEQSWPTIGTTLVECSQAQWTLVCETKVLPSPFTVAITILPLALLSPPAATNCFFSSSI